MFRSLLINTLVSALAYFIVSVVGLLLVPMLVSAYGLSEFGLIVLVRLLLPTGILGPFDFGVSELATLAVARARADESWAVARDTLQRLLVIAGLSGLLLGAGLALAAAPVTALLRVGPEHAQGFADLVRLSAACLPFLFPGLVAEGIVKGFEAYRALRAIEVFSALAYAVLAYACVRTGAGYFWVAAGFLAVQVLRALQAAVLARRLVMRSPLAGAAAQAPAGIGRELFARCRTMAWNKTLGMLQQQSSPLLCGVLLGPAATGLFDVLARLPRFAKAVVGLMNSALLPVAARFDAGQRTQDMRRLGQTGLLAVTVATLPPLAGAAVFSEAIMRVWVGSEMAALWGWQALMFAMPAFSALVSFGATALLGRAQVVVRMNRLVSAQIVIQIVLALATLDFWDARAFMFGQVVAMALTFPAQMRLILREQEVDPVVWRRLGLILALGLALALGCWALGLPAWPGSTAGVLTALAAWCGLYWLLLYAVLLTARERRRLREVCMRRGRGVENMARPV